MSSSCWFGFQNKTDYLDQGQQTDHTILAFNMLLSNVNDVVMLQRFIFSHRLSLNTLLCCFPENLEYTVSFVLLPRHPGPFMPCSFWLRTSCDNVWSSLVGFSSLWLFKTEKKPTNVQQTGNAACLPDSLINQQFRILKRVAKTMCSVCFYTELSVLIFSRTAFTFSHKASQLHLTFESHFC